MAKNISNKETIHSSFDTRAARIYSVFNEANLYALSEGCFNIEEDLFSWLAKDIASLEQKKSIITCLIKSYRSSTINISSIPIYNVAVLFDTVLPGLDARSMVCESDTLNASGFLEDVETRLSLIEGHFPEEYIRTCKNRSDYLLQYCIQASAKADSFSSNELLLLRGSFRRLPDILKILSCLQIEDDPALLEIMGSLVMDSCHIIDDVYDAIDKAKSKGFSNQEDVTRAFTGIARKVSKILVESESKRRSLLDNFEDLLLWFAKWVEEDSTLGNVDRHEAEQRVRRYNGDLYYRIASLGTPMENVSPEADFVRTYGEITWILDDWRDLELDRVTNHFNLFLGYPYDDQSAYFYFKKIILARLGFIYKSINEDDDLYAELTTSLALTDESLWGVGSVQRHLNEKQ